MKRLAILLALLLAGCGAAPRVSDLGQADLRPKASAQVMEPCASLPALGGRTMGDLLTYADALAGLYGECALLNRLKADWIRSQGLAP